MKRTPFSELTWRDKPVEELGRSELLELVEVLHGMVWDSAQNFEDLLTSQRAGAPYAGRQ